MRWLIACVLALCACRTPPLPSSDGGGAVSDLAFGDLCIAACPVECPVGAWCVFLNRGDCSTWGCMLPQGSCGNGAPTCACAGGDQFCQLFARSGEKLTCVDQTPFGWCGQEGFANLTCQSSLLCV